jgi:MerR family transcriptional regulator, light-induced transcriptional regulator
MADADTEATIAAVERDTGIGKDTLRMWERRYGFPAPQRNPFGERTYPTAQVAKLRVLKRLLDAGLRPGRIVGLPIDELMRLAGTVEPSQAADQESSASATPAHEALALLRSNDIVGLRRQFDLFQAHAGVDRFVTELLAPLNTLIGEAWMRGQLEVFQEHAYSELVRRTLAQALLGLSRTDALDRPRVLLTTLRDEPHSLGLLMAEVAFWINGARCTSLGVQTPLVEIVRAAQAYRADIVAIGFSGCNGPNAILNGLAELRAQLPVDTELWTGGAVASLRRRVVDGVRVLPVLADVPVELQRWRAARGS